MLVKFVLPRFNVRPTAAKAPWTSKTMVCKVVLFTRSTTSLAYATCGNQRTSMRNRGPRLAQDSCNDVNAISVTSMNRKGYSGASLCECFPSSDRFLCCSMFEANVSSYSVQSSQDSAVIDLVKGLRHVPAVRFSVVVSTPPPLLRVSSCKRLLAKRFGSGQPH